MLSVFAICVGACLGALARWALALWLNPVALAAGATGAGRAALSIPLGTLAANLVGAYLVGVAVALFQALPQLDPVWRLALITGFLGALTTFSTFSVEVVTMLQQARYGLAVATVLLHVICSLFFTLIGIKTFNYCYN